MQVSTGPFYQPSNVFKLESKLSPDLKRVVVLPLTLTTDAGSAASAAGTLSQTLRGELGKARLFELVDVDALTLKSMTGRGEWGAEERLPRDFFEKLVSRYDGQAVLFATVTTYRGYPPVAIGWRLRLVDAKSFRILWSVDEVLDAGQPAVANSAQRYYLDQRFVTEQLVDASTILGSPGRFAQFSVAALVATLPSR